MTLIRIGCDFDCFFFLCSLNISVDWESKAAVHRFIIKLTVKQWSKLVIQYVEKIFTSFKRELSKQRKKQCLNMAFIPLGPLMHFIFNQNVPYVLFFRDVNNNIMELLIMAYACKTSSARSIVGVIPYLPYSKQCKMRKRGCIVSKLLAKVCHRCVLLLLLFFGFQNTQTNSCVWCVRFLINFYWLNG